MADELGSLLAAMTIVAIAPLIAAFLPGHVPQVVLLILGGILIGPELLGWGAPEDIELAANLGLGFLFLLAGYELDPALLRGRAGRLAIISWSIAVVASVAIVGALAAAGVVRAFLPVAIGLTTTALGTLLPILRENDMLRDRFGRLLFAAGAVGEMGPVLAIALLLGHYGSLLEVVGVAAVAGVAFVLAAVPRWIHGTTIDDVIARTQHETTQTTLRLTVLLLVLLLFLSSRFGLDVVLGAFFAGMVLRRWNRAERATLEHKLDALGYGFFIPVFFVSSGMGLDVASIIESPLRLALFFVLLLVVRGLPALLVYRHDLPAIGRVQMMLLTATALPLLVALAEIGIDNGSMLPENAAALVGAGVLSVAVFPLLSVRLQPRALAVDADPDDTAG